MVSSLNNPQPLLLDTLPRYGDLSPVVAAASVELIPRAAVWAEALGLPLLPEPVPDPRYGEAPLLLSLTEQGLMLQSTGRGAPGPVWVNWEGGKADHRRRQGGGKGQLIAKAVGLSRARQPLQIFDATAGLGQDGFVLATLGCSVTLMERSPVMAALLQDGMERARAAPDAALREIVARLQLVAGDSLTWLAEQEADSLPVIYLDPMFPGRDKSSLVKKEMRVSRHVVGKDSDAPALLAAALGAARYRVVVKRPRKAPVIGGPVPDLQLPGKSSRYDIYTFRALP
ncbi:MAG: SAM-dependent methyltransferase [Halomonadaceae bacterium]|nr:MAG: SAM-dependent methyltransferase [Halomonadaceae bacterium]